MLPRQTTYTIELLCDYAEWWRYNVYIMAVGYDRDGNRVSFNEFTDRIYELDHSGDVRPAPEGFTVGSRKIELITDPCAYADIYIYAVTNTFPNSPLIKDSPPFDITLTVAAAGKQVERAGFKVNQWGGLTVVAHRVGASAEQGVSGA